MRGNSEKSGSAGLHLLFSFSSSSFYLPLCPFALPAFERKSAWLYLLDPGLVSVLVVSHPSLFVSLSSTGFLPFLSRLPLNSFSVC